MKYLVEGSQVITQVLARVENEDPRVNPNPWASVVCLIVSYGGAQDDDVFEYPAPGRILQANQIQNLFPHPVCQHMSAECAVRVRRSLIGCLDESAILDFEFGVAYQVNEMFIGPVASAAF